MVSCFGTSDRRTRISVPFSLNKPLPVERTGNRMTNTTVLITHMAILAGIFLLGFLAKIFPRSGRNADSKQ